METKKKTAHSFLVTSTRPHNTPHDSVLLCLPNAMSVPMLTTSITPPYLHQLLGQAQMTLARAKDAGVNLIT